MLVIYFASRYIHILPFSCWVSFDNDFALKSCLSYNVDDVLQTLKRCRLFTGWVFTRKCFIFAEGSIDDIFPYHLPVFSRTLFNNFAKHLSVCSQSTYLHFCENLPRKNHLLRSSEIYRIFSKRKFWTLKLR